MQLNACMLRRRARLRLNPVPRWFPGRGTAFDTPPVRIFYSSKVRAGLDWWKMERASRAVINCVTHGYKLAFTSPPTPFRTAPLLVAPEDVEFAIADLLKGDSLGTYQALLPGGENFLSRTSVHTVNAKQRVVHNYRRINDVSIKQSCRYESVKDLPALL